MHNSANDVLLTYQVRKGLKISVFLLALTAQYRELTSSSAYVFGEAAGDVVIKSVEDMSKQRWQREVQEGSKNYDPTFITEEKIQQNKE